MEPVTTNTNDRLWPTTTAQHDEGCGYCGYPFDRGQRVVCIDEEGGYVYCGPRCAEAAGEVLGP